MAKVASTLQTALKPIRNRLLEEPRVAALPTRVALSTALPAAVVGSSNATAADETEAPLDLLLPPASCEKGQSLPLLHVPFGKNTHGTVALAFALASASGGGPFGSLLPLPLPLPLSLPFPSPLAAPLALALDLALLLPFGVPLGGFPGAAGTAVSFAGTAVAFDFVFALAS